MSRRDDHDTAGSRADEQTPRQSECHQDLCHFPCPLLLRRLPVGTTIASVHCAAVMGITFGANPAPTLGAPSKVNPKTDTHAAVAKEAGLPERSRKLAGYFSVRCAPAIGPLLPVLSESSFVARRPITISPDFSH